MNLYKIIDDLTLKIQNIGVNADITTALSQKRAIDRATYIQKDSISYNCHISYTENSDHYTGLAEITFTLTSIPRILPLDCINEKIFTLIVNGITIVRPIRYG